MEIHRSGARPSRKGEADYFTGEVDVLPVIEAPAPARVRAVSVTFAPGGRTYWHTHPLGQSLLITAGSGRVQRWGGPVETVISRRRHLVPTWRKALARRRRSRGDDPHCYPGGT